MSEQTIAMMLATLSDEDLRAELRRREAKDADREMTFAEYKEWLKQELYDEAQP